MANAFLKHTGAWRIRGITRDPSSEKASTWAAIKGVDLIQADQGDAESLRRAFVGAHAIFAVTDFTSCYNKILHSKRHEERSAIENKTINRLAAEMEITQGMNVAEAASDPAVLDTLEKFVLSTLTGIKTVSKGKYPSAFQFDSKATIESRVREFHPELAKRLSTVNLGAYQENIRDLPLVFGPHKEEDGVYRFLRLRHPGPHEAHPEVIAAKDTGNFVEALVLRHPAGTDVLGASEVITRAEYSALWGRVLGVKTDVKYVSETEYAKYIPEDLQDELIEFFKFVSEYGYAGGNTKLKMPFELGIKTTPLEEFIQGEDWAEILH